MAGTLAVAAIVTVATLSIRRNYALMSPRASIMVLPFRNASNDPEQDYFVDAVTADLTTDLSRLSATLVISSAMAFTYKGKAVDPREIGREFRVRYCCRAASEKPKRRRRPTHTSSMRVRPRNFGPIGSTVTLPTFPSCRTLSTSQARRECSNST
jgi:hypothetical protein